MRSICQRLLPPLFAIVLVALVLSPYLLGYIGITPNVGTNDLTDTQIPFRKSLQDSLRQGRLPLWDPRISAGFPFLAEGQSGSLHPINLFFAILPLTPWLSTNFSVVTAILISVIGMYVYLIRWLNDKYTDQEGINRLCSLFGATVWGLSGFHLNHIAHLNILNVISLLPWQLAIIDKLHLSKPSKKAAAEYIVLLTFTIALQILAGHPQFMAYSVMFLGLYWLITELLSSKDQKLKSLINNLLVIVISILLAAAIGAVQLLPTLEFSRYSTRQSGLNEEAINFLSLRIKDLQTFITPFYNFDPNPRSLAHLAEIGWPFDERYSYMGLIPLFLAVISLIFIIKDRRTITLTLLGIFFLLLSLGNQSPTGILLKIPPLSMFRIPVKFTLFFQLAIAVLSAFALTNLLPRLIKPSKSQANTKSFAVVIGILLLLSVIDSGSKLYKMYPIVKGDNWYNYPQTVQSYQQNASTSLKDYEDRVIGQNYNDQLNKQYLKQAESLWEQKQLTLFKNNRAIIPASNMLLYDVPLLTNAVNSMGLKIKWYSDIENNIFFTNYADKPDDTTTSYSDDYWKLSRLTGARYLIHDTTLAANDYVNLIAKTNFDTGQDQIGLYKFIRSLPFIQTPEQIINVTESQTFKTILASQFNPQSQLVISDSNIKLKSQTLNSTIKYTALTPTQLQIKLTNSNPSILLIRQAYYPGWTAIVNGKKSDILRVDHAFQGIYLKQLGPLDITLKYQPLSFQIGLYITITGLFVWLFLIILAVIPSRVDQ